MYRVAIMADGLDFGGGGIRVYLDNLIRNIVKYKTSDLDLVVIRGKKSMTRRFEGVREIIISHPGKAYRRGYLSSALPYARKLFIKYLRDLKILRILEKMDIDLLHIPDLGGAQAPPVAYHKYHRLVVTLHGVSPLVLPPNIHYRGLAILKYLLVKYDVFRWKTFFRKRVLHIITVSRSAKQNIVQKLGIPTDKVSVIYNGVDDKIFRPLSREKVLEELHEKYGVPEEFFLHISAYQPKKNVETILKAYYILRKKYKVAAKLVIVGRQPDRLKRLASRLNISRGVIFTGYIPSEDIPKFYNATIAFIFPSLHEANPLPLLEAMACGCAIVTSNIPPCVEVVENSALIVDPRSPVELANAMHILLEDENLRTKLEREVLEKAKKFTWEKSAKEYIKVYMNILAKISRK